MSSVEKALNDAKHPRQIIGTNSPASAYVINDYPWGFVLKTQQRRWIETSEKHGQRLCIQTKDPKRGHWCAVKKSTYSWLEVMYVDAEGKVQGAALTIYDASNLDKLSEFEQTWYLDEWQQKRIDDMRHAVAHYNKRKAQQLEAKP